jgi:hypothetical protein
VVNFDALFNQAAARAAQEQDQQQKPETPAASVN